MFEKYFVISQKTKSEQKKLSKRSEADKGLIKSDIAKWFTINFNKKTPKTKMNNFQNKHKGYIVLWLVGFNFYRAVDLTFKIEWKS